MRCCLIIGLVIMSLPSYARVEGGAGEGSLQMPSELEKAQLEDKAGVKLPFDVAMVNQDGEHVLLGDYFTKGDKRPVILTIGYYGCPMLCSLVLNGLVDVLKKISYTFGKDYRMISVSIDERETPELAKKKAEAYITALGAPSDTKNWQFHVMKASESKRLADAVGFNFVYIKRDNQFAHGAGFFVISPEGVLARTMFGISFEPSHMKLALSDAADGKIGSLVDRVLLSCFHYDPDSHRYGVYIFGVMRLGGIVTILLLCGLLFMYFRGEKKRAVK